MTIATISGTVTTTVMPGAGSYAAQLTIGSTGEVNTGSTGIALWLTAPATVENDGIIRSTGTLYDAAVLQSGLLLNKGTIDAHIGVSVSAGATLINDGFITFSSYAPGGDGVVLAGGELDNAGTIWTRTGVSAHGTGTISNSGYIAAIQDGVAGGAALYNSGTLLGVRYGVLADEAGMQVVNAGTIFGGRGALLDGYSGLGLTVLPGAVFSGTVQDMAGDAALTLGAGPSAGTGSLDIGSFTGFSQIAFAAGASWTLEGSLSQLAGGQTISGFTSHDKLVLDGFSAGNETFIAGLGLVLSEGTQQATLDIHAASYDFGITTANGRTTITAACFCAGTRIATPQGEARVEALRIGDSVLTLHAGVKQIKWIGRRAYAAPFADGDFIRPIRIRPGALDDDVPRRALNLSPGHALFLGGALVPAWRLLNGASVTQAAHVELVEYYHIELDAPEVILAEGCPVESFAGAEFRGQFQNAPEFAELYPDARDQPPYLALLEDGFALEAEKTRIARRAGLPPALPDTPGMLRGFVDVAGPLVVEGWAQDEAAPEVPVVLDIFSGGLRLGRLPANRYRADLRAAGLGTGCHGFRFVLPGGSQDISVRRTADGAALPLTDEARKVA